MPSSKFKFLPNPSNPLQELELAIAEILIVDGEVNDKIRQVSHNYMKTEQIMGGQEQANELHRIHVMMELFIKQLVTNTNNLGRLAGSQEGPLELIRRAPLKSPKSST